MTDTLSPRGHRTDDSQPGERPLRADARRNRERILKAARTVFSQAGNDAQIDDVARRAGVGVGTVYRHFPTKEALMVELVRQKFRLLADRGREVLEREGEPFALLAEVMRANAQELQRDAVMHQILAGFDDQIWDRALSEQDQVLMLTAELVERAKRAGTIRADATAYDVAMVMCGVCATMSRRSPGFDWRRHLELAIDALRPRAVR